MPSLVFIDVVESEYDGREITTLYGETIVVQMNMELDTVEIEGLKNVILKKWGINAY